MDKINLFLSFLIACIGVSVMFAGVVFLVWLIVCFAVFDFRDFGGISWIMIRFFGAGGFVAGGMVWLSDPVNFISSK